MFVNILYHPGQNEYQRKEIIYSRLQLQLMKQICQQFSPWSHLHDEQTDIEQIQFKQLKPLQQRSNYPQKIQIPPPLTKPSFRDYIENNPIEKILPLPQKKQIKCKVIRMNSTETIPTIKESSKKISLIKASNIFRTIARNQLKIKIAQKENWQIKSIQYKPHNKTHKIKLNQQYTRIRNSLNQSFSKQESLEFIKKHRQFKKTDLAQKTKEPPYNKRCSSDHKEIKLKQQYLSKSILKNLSLFNEQKQKGIFVKQAKLQKLKSYDIKNSDKMHILDKFILKYD